MSSSHFDPLSGEGFVVYLRKQAQDQTDPAEQHRLLTQARILEERLAWKLTHTWPGLFRLYQHPDGSWQAQFESALQERKQHFEEGVLPSDREVLSCLTALEAILASTQLFPLKRLPLLTDIPAPIQSNTTLDSNILEIHKAAICLFNRTIGAAIMANSIQETIAPGVLALTEGSLTERLQSAKRLKKSLAKAIDVLARQDCADVLHRNKPLFKDKDCHAKPIGLIVLEAAKDLVEEERRLPTKHELRIRVEQRLPHVRLGDRRWPEIFKEAGLHKLPSKTPFQEKS